VSRHLLYVAYPMRLDLGAANAIQTHNTVRELQRLRPGVTLIIPRWLREPSAFESLNAIHLPRPAVNKLSRLLPWAGWSYIERTLYSLMLVMLLTVWRLMGRGFRVLYVRDAVCAAWLGLLRGIHGARIVYEVHDLEASHPSKASRWPRSFWSIFLPWLDRMALRKASRLVSLTDTFKRWAVERRIKRPFDIAVVPDAFDPAVYYPMDRQEARGRLGLPLDSFIVGYSGLTFAYRRLDLLVEAFASARRGVPGAMLVLVGGRPAEVEELRAQAARLGIGSEQLVLPGQLPQEDAALYVNAADVLVIPDTVTGMTASPLKLFEYMAVGKPIVCKDMPALREVLDDASALFFPEGDAEALASAISELAAHPDRRESMGRAAIARSQRYTYAARAKKILEVVEACR
jgi:glycosyltransferase involved in cell wall biosynthesis